MKHPNKKVEAHKKWQATSNLKSCFNFWLNKPNQYWLETVRKRRVEKTIVVKFEDL